MHVMVAASQTSGTVHNAGAPREMVDALLIASRALVGVSARSLAAVESHVTLPQFRALVVLGEHFRGTGIRQPSDSGRETGPGDHRTFAFAHRPEPVPTLVHGDAQESNFVSTRDGAVLVDACPYFGHPELNLALVDYFEPVPPAYWTRVENVPGWQRISMIAELCGASSATCTSSHSMVTTHSASGFWRASGMQLTCTRDAKLTASTAASELSPRGRALGDDARSRLLPDDMTPVERSG